jgi:hypothetical protein
MKVSIEVNGNRLCIVGGGGTVSVVPVHTVVGGVSPIANYISPNRLVPETSSITSLDLNNHGQRHSCCSSTP